MRDKIELLAPAGDFDSLVAAVQNGADAVYLGGGMFNARRGADNFDGEEMKRAVEYAHLYNVKVYITFNILIKEREIDDAIEFLQLLDELNVDAVIVQDIGLAKLIRDTFPSLRIHGSTQMTIHNLQGLKTLRDMGMSRAVLARENTLEEIQLMSREGILELETFVHGALCISYSGQCLMSSILGGRSGNRGMCAQPCRLPYELIDHRGSVIKSKGHLLSPKDLSSYDFVHAIGDAGVTSLKIEGRMKRPEYVGIITRAYREIIDTSAPSDSRREELLQIFNRGGFTRGYYFGMDNRDIICTEKPNNWGIYIGKVSSSSGNNIKLSLQRDLAIGDGIEFWVDKGKNWGQVVDKLYLKEKSVERGYGGQVITLNTKRPVVPGTKVYKTSSMELIDDIGPSFQALYDHRKIDIDIEGYFRIGKIPYIRVRDSQGIEGYASGEEPIEEARSSPLSQSDIRAQVERLGGTPFLSRETNISMDDNIFVPKSIINRLRRQAIDGLIENRRYKFERVEDKPMAMVKRHGEMALENTPSSSRVEKPELILYTHDLDLDEGILKNVEGICICPSDWAGLDIESVMRAVERYRGFNKFIRLSLPRILHQRDIELILSLDPRFWTLFDSYQGGNLGTLALLKDLGVKRIIADFPLNITNSYSIGLLQEMDINGAVLSPELTTGELDDIIKNSNMDLEILVYGHLPVMVMQYCMAGGASKNCRHCTVSEGVSLRDRKGVEFPIKKIQLANCYIEILNSLPIFVAHHLRKIIGLGARYLGINGLYGHENIETVTQIYRYILDRERGQLPRDIENAIESIISRGHTNGHFFRGVQ